MTKQIKKTFSAAVYKIGINPTITIPEEVSSELGIKGFTKVRCNLRNFDFTTTLIPADTKPHRLYLNAEVSEKTGISFGDVAEITIELDN